MSDADELFEQLRKRIERPIHADLKTVVRRIACPMCGCWDFVRGSGFFAHFVQDTPGTTQIGGKRLETVHLICANCGFVAQHAPSIFTATAVLPSGWDAHFAGLVSGYLPERIRSEEEERKEAEKP